MEGKEIEADINILFLTLIVVHDHIFSLNNYCLVMTDKISVSCYLSLKCLGKTFGHYPLPLLLGQLQSLQFG